jgi:glycosyltransferase involved in cell wall biosynthesis
MAQLISHDEDHTPDNRPLVSICIPTYNRADILRSTVESALRQDYVNIEVVISDNASTDNTAQLCARFCTEDPRIRYIRHASNQGPTANFVAAFRASHGNFFMWLGDDDWIDDSYVRCCMEQMLSRPDIAAVSGSSHYYRNDRHAFQGKHISLLGESAACRLLAYYGKVTDNAMFYAVMRRELLTHAPLLEAAGNDWLLVATIAYQGKLLTLENTRLHRRLGGATNSYAAIAAALRLSWFQAHFPYVSIGMNAYRDIAYRAPAYSGLARIQRHLLGATALTLILGRKAVLHLIKQLLAALRRLITIPFHR